MVITLFKADCGTWEFLQEVSFKRRHDGLNIHQVVCLSVWH